MANNGDENKHELEKDEDLDKDDDLELEEPHKPYCPKCGSTDIRGSHAHRALDYLLKSFGLRPYRCRSCRKRFYMRKPDAPIDAAPPEPTPKS